MSYHGYCNRKDVKSILVNDDLCKLVTRHQTYTIHSLRTTDGFPKNYHKLIPLTKLVPNVGCGGTNRTRVQDSDVRLADVIYS